MLEYVILFLVILLADFIAEVTVEAIKYYRNKDMEDIKCDGCGRVRKTRLTKDKYYWMCKDCLPVYNEENLTEEERTGGRERTN